MYNKIPSHEEMLLLDNATAQSHWVKIEILDSEENFIEEIQGRVATGSNISIDGSSSVRRSTNFTFYLTEEDNPNLSDIGNLLSLNKKVRILEGIENDGILLNYPSIIWIPLGIFVLGQPSISSSSSGVNISLNCKDKMCLLNGEVGGSFPTSIVFNEYDQIIGHKKMDNFPEKPNTYTVYEINNKYYMWSGTKWIDSSYDMVGQVVQVEQRLYDIIQTVVCNYGGIPLSKIFINDVPLELKQLVRFTGTGNLYYNVKNSVYTLDANATLSSPEDWKVFGYNEDVGYIYTDFVYPGELVTSIGDNVCTVLDKIKEVLGNYEYFFDVNGNFVFQEIKNYLNNSYDPTIATRLDNNRKIEIASNGLSILDKTNYLLDIKSNSKSAYNFCEGNGLISSYSNSLNYNNIKNDYHIWGKNGDKSVIHYHVAIKRKPEKMNTYCVVFLTDSDGNYTGRIRLATEEEAKLAGYEYKDETLTIKDNTQAIYESTDETIKFIKNATVKDSAETLVLTDVAVSLYTPSDWRAELYLQGLVKKSQQIRPDVYEQELLDLFDDIYNFKEKQFKMDYVTSPNNLVYFFDYLEPSGNMFDYSIDLIGPKLYSYSQDKIKKLYSVDVPNLILINLDSDNRQHTIDRCKQEGQAYSNVSKSVYDSLSIGTFGYSAQEVMRDLLYQHTNYNESISLTAVPIYHLDVNTRITVDDENSNIHGDYIIKSLSLPIGGQGAMNISATRALEKI